ncbi:MAG: hypothetical protein IJA20_00945 [Methanocorpusculum sp.]|nr:hypothetical protein [Methanocorpusculum sp.]
MKKFLMILLVLAMVFSMAGVVSADDVTGDTQASEGTTEETQTTPTVPLQPADKTEGMDLEYDLVSTYVLKIPSDVSFNTNLEHTGEVSLSNVLLPAKSMITVTVNSLHDFNLQNGADTDFIVSRIPYSVIRDNGKIVANYNPDNVVLVVSEGVSENAEKLTFKTEGKGATLSGKHTDRLTFNAHWSVNPNAETEITIGSLEQLKKFRDSVNAGNGYEGTTVKLTADIDLEGEEWTPIGTSSTKFKGVFDGDGHTIKNLKITSDNDGDKVGFFSAVDTNGKVQNVIFDGAVVNVKTRGVGVVAGNGGTFDSVTVKNAKVSSYGQAGGIVGGGVYGSVTNCKVYDSEITAVPNGDATNGYDNGDKVGGIVGLHTSDTTGVVTGNEVSGLTLKAYRDIGGIAGAADGSKVKDNKVNDVLIIVDQVTISYGDKDENAAEIFGPRFKDDCYLDPSNTAKDVFIWIMGEDIEEVSSPAALKAFAMDVDLGNDYYGKTVTLTADLDLEKYDSNGERVSFDPIGYGYNVVFKGTFDGQGHTIKNLYQNGWALGLDYSTEGGGLFASVVDATIKDLNVDNADIVMECIDMGVVVGYSYGNCVYENIKVTNSRIQNYNRYTGGVVGEVNGKQTFKNVIVEDTKVSSLWGTPDCVLGGIVGGIWGDAELTFKDCTVNCEIDSYNDVVSNYQWYNYRLAGMLIGNVDISDTNVADPTDYVTCENVVVTYGDWINYHYCEDSSYGTPSYAGEGEYKFKRVEAGASTDGIDLTKCEHDETETHNQLIVFDQLFGGDKGVSGLNSYEGVTVNYPASYTPEA